MKKIYILFVMLLPVVSQAQITIVQSDLPIVGSGYINAVDDNYNAPMTPGGASQNWNYAGLLNADQDSLLCLSATGTPYAGIYPQSNLAALDPNTGSWIYFISNSTGFKLNGGMVTGFGNPLVFNPPQMIIPVPFTYTNLYNGYARVQYDTTTVYMGNTVQARIVLYQNINISGDGYGSLTIPTGTTANTLRIKTTTLETDSVYINVPVFGWIPLPGFTPIQSQTTNFKWLRNGGGTLLLEIDADSLGQTANRSSYLLYYGVVGVAENMNASSQPPYPNPSASIITFSFNRPADESETLAIFSPDGKLVDRFDVRKLDSFSFSTRSLPQGIYFYSSQSSARTLQMGRFAVVH